MNAVLNPQLWGGGKKTQTQIPNVVDITLVIT